MHRKIRPVEIVAIVCPHLLPFIGGEIILDSFQYGSMQIKILRWNIEGECQNTFIPPVMFYGANNLKQIIISFLGESVYTRSASSIWASVEFQLSSQDT